MRLPNWLHSDHTTGEGPTSLRFRSWGSRYTLLHVIQMKGSRDWAVWMISALELHKIARALGIGTTELLEADPIKESLERSLAAMDAVKKALASTSQGDLHAFLHHVVNKAMQPGANEYSVVAEIADELNGGDQ